ncbi:hypothetical protein FDF74_12665 [Clostridium niameyense]|uniref:Phage protein Gp138 N-terminal domain-containing protein n=1 Tax=Clostridium niameyense TaxID=1622073 RepID=A0A6M0RCW5_9CLOT|nr:Gp138 family membrane-puncturing spike protein [Clostridium niameyense]NEZ48023.1 hypothetical protein [Clostridium niameyense]
MKQVAGLFQDVIAGIGNNTNCLMIGKILSYNNDNTATVEPMHCIPKQNKPYNPLICVPIGFFSLGGYSIKVKPSKGDLILLMFTDYDIDNLLIDGKSKKPNTDRTHALEDCIAIPLSINFLNNAFNATEDLVITKEGTNAYVKIKNNGDIILNSDRILLGENADKRILKEGTYSENTYIPEICKKVYGE